MKDSLYSQVGADNLLGQEADLNGRTDRQGQVDASLDVDSGGEGKGKIKGKSSTRIDLKKAGNL